MKQIVKSNDKKKNPSQVTICLQEKKKKLRKEPEFGQLTIFERRATKELFL